MFESERDRQCLSRLMARLRRVRRRLIQPSIRPGSFSARSTVDTTRLIPQLARPSSRRYDPAHSAARSSVKTSTRPGSFRSSLDRQDVSGPTSTRKRHSAPSTLRYAVDAESATCRQYVRVPVCSLHDRTGCVCSRALQRLARLPGISVENAWFY